MSNLGLWNGGISTSCMRACIVQQRKAADLGVLQRPGLNCKPIHGHSPVSCMPEHHWQAADLACSHSALLIYIRPFFCESFFVARFFLPSPLLLQPACPPCTSMFLGASSKTSTIVKAATWQDSQPQPRSCRRAWTPQTLMGMPCRPVPGCLSIFGLYFLWPRAAGPTIKLEYS